jgi:hypothetical protein
MQTGEEITGWMKHVGVTVRRQNYIHLTIDIRLFCGNVRYILVQHLLSPRIVFTYIKYRRNLANTTAGGKGRGEGAKLTMRLRIQVRISS